MNNAFQYSRFDNFLIELTKEFPQSAICTNDGTPLHIRFLNLADIGTLPQAASQTHKYLNLKDGEIAICNDPYSGGSTLCSITLVMAVKFSQKKSETILICLRVPFKPRVSLSQSLDEEGLRIPPMPICVNGKLNTDMIAAMCGHPLCPHNFQTILQQNIEKLQHLHDKTMMFTKELQLDWSKAALKGFLDFSKKRFHQALSDMSIGEAAIECSVSSGENIKLRTVSTGEKIIFDFSGTTPSKTLALTDSATLGACIGPLLTTFDQLVPLNEGLFECIELIAPKGTLVNADYPSAVFRGMTDGTTVIANLITRSLGMIDEQQKMAVHGYSLCSFELDFGDQYFFETVEPGTAANAQFHGQSGVSLWKRNNLNPRLEEIENIFPLEIKSYTIRSNSGGSGLKRGGDGISKSIKVLKPAQFKWAINEPFEHPQGVEGGKMAYAAEAYIIRKGGKKEPLEKMGQLKLEPGDIIIMSSSGGGGYGAQ